MTFHLDLSKKYLLGISGGCDSMTLLSLCAKQGANLVVAHVNYKLRTNADKEQKIVEDFCQEHHIECFVAYPRQTQKGNFENWAREARYQFYQQIYEQEKCDALLLGHQLDDHIETYLMALERKSHGWYYGIKKENCHHNMHIIRPLLDYRKQDTRNYCLKNHIPFGDDESNFSDDYTRNKIRHHMVEPASQQQIEKWQQEIIQLNQEIQNDLDYIASKFNDDEVSLLEYREQTKRIRHTVLRLQIEKYISQPLNQSFIDEIDHQIMRCDKLRIQLNEKCSLFVEQNLIYAYYNKIEFEYRFEQLQYVKTPYFELSDHGQKIQGVSLSQDDFPIIIRNGKNDDKIQLRFGTKKLNRIFIDKKMLHKERIGYPVIVNKNNEVIFVPNIGCDVAHYTIKPNLFMV